jgi:triacylglycerol lipase
MDDLSARHAGSPQPPGPAWRREVAAYLLQGRLIAAAALRRATRLEGEHAVVFVHGFMAAGPVFDPMRSRVEEATGLPTLDFTYSPFGSFPRAAERLASCIEQTVAPGVRISLVGHSLKGLLARWYVQEMGGGARVDRLVTLATPHRGTPAARAVPLPLLQAARSDGPVIRQLERSAAALEALPHVAVAAGEDRVVPPHSAAGAPHARVEWLAGVGHNELLYDARAHRIVSEAVGGD